MATGVGSAAAALLLLLTVAIGVARRPGSAARLYAWVAIPQVAVLVAMALVTGGALLWTDAALVLIVKFFWVPSLLRRYRWGGVSDYGMGSGVAPAVLFLGAAALAVLCLRLGGLIEPRHGVAVGLCFAALLLGFGTPIVRSELWCQVSGVLAGEGALAASILLLVGEVAVAEGLMLAEVVFLAVVFGQVADQVRRLHGSADARLLEELRG